MTGDDSPVLTSPVAPTVTQPSSRAVSPLGADRYLVKFSATAATIAKLERAQELLSHAIPNDDMGRPWRPALVLERVPAAPHAWRDERFTTTGPARPTSMVDGRGTGEHSVGGHGQVAP